MKLTLLRPGALLASMLCFLLPFCDLRCNNTSLVTVKGYSFIIGRDLSNYNPLTGEDEPALEGRETLHSDADNIKPSPYAIAALACALFALLAWYFVRNREGDLIVLILSFTGALMLVFFRLSFGRTISAKAEDGLMAGVDFSLNFLPGYYLAILGLVVSGISTILLLRKEEEPETEVFLNTETPANPGDTLDVNTP